MSVHLTVCNLDPVVCRFVFPCNESGYWNIDVILTLDGLPPVSLPMVRRDGIMLAIPLDLSYHCSTELLWTNLYLVNDSSETTYYGVKITGLQVCSFVVNYGGV